MQWSHERRVMGERRKLPAFTMVQFHTPLRRSTVPYLPAPRLKNKWRSILVSMNLQHVLDGVGPLRRLRDSKDHHQNSAATPGEVFMGTSDVHVSCSPGGGLLWSPGADRPQIRGPSGTQVHVPQDREPNEKNASGTYLSTALHSH